MVGFDLGMLEIEISLNQSEKVVYVQSQKSYIYLHLNMVTEIPCISNNDKAVFKAPNGKGRIAIFAPNQPLSIIERPFVSEHHTN